MSAAGVVMISAAVVLAAVFDWIKFKRDRRKFTGEELRRIIKKFNCSNTGEIGDQSEKRQNRMDGKKHLVGGPPDG